uniref:Uncharacterized protein n=1 Tax=Utricularia reniformis TaxID=192314 RepID=A0A1Y0AZ50_9LAMI|nr:hypothetical protein AEK19_MT0162 [Utricularia reniformis]ART30445.1 hypothetical protein AEK19_MT0162 [Utricularia reniformis]
MKSYPLGAMKLPYFFLSSFFLRYSYLYEC